jgi:tetratricopeptide (TPR) repeat protein
MTGRAYFLGMGRICFVLAVLLCTVLLLPFSAARAEEDEKVGERVEFTASRSFNDTVRRDRAEAAALAAALSAAYEHVGRELSGKMVPDFREAAVRLGIPGEALFEGLACVRFPVRRLNARVDGLAPNRRVTVGVVLERSGGGSLADALKNADRVEAGGRLVARLRAVLARYDAAADALLNRGAGEPEDEEAAHELQWAADRLNALEILRDVLSGRAGDEPRLLEGRLAEALRLAPDDPLLLTLSACNRLLLDSPAAALEQVDAALALAPDFARAHDARGTALLRQGLPALAADAFGRAVALAPDNPVYLLHRASAYFVLKENKEMCADFRAACALGDCDGLAWALESAGCQSF